MKLKITNGTTVQFVEAMSSQRIIHNVAVQLLTAGL